MKQKGKPKPIQAAALHFGGDAFRRAQQGHAGDVAIFKDKPEDCNSLFSFIFLGGKVSQRHLFYFKCKQPTLSVPGAGKPKPIQAAALHFGGDAFRRAQ
jgi:hypothetical protein